MRKRVKGVIQDRPRRTWTSDKPKHNTPGPSIVSKDELVFESDVRFEGDVVGMPSVVENRWHLAQSHTMSGRRLVAKLGETGGNGTYDAISLKGTLIDHNGNFGQHVPDVVGFTVTFVPYPTSNNTYAPRFNITMDSDPGDECELELWENDLNASGGATEVYLVLNVQRDHMAYTITWNKIDGELSAVGVTSPESNNYLWDSAGFAKQECIAYKHDNHLYKYITGFDDQFFTTICHVSDAGIAGESDYASFIKVVLSGVVGNHVTMVEADIMVGHSSDIAVRSNSLFYGQMNLRIIQDYDDTYVLQAKAVFNASASAAGNPLGLKVDITSYAGAIVEFGSTGSYVMNDLDAYQVHEHTTITGQRHTSANNGTRPYKIMLEDDTLQGPLNTMKQVDETNRSFSTTWAVGKTWSTFYKKAGSKILFMASIPMRNDSSSWGGMYTRLEFSLDSTSIPADMTWTSLGDTGYDTVMEYGQSIHHWDAGQLIDHAGIVAHHRVTFRFQHKSYSGTTTIRTSNSLSNGEGKLGQAQITLIEIKA